MQVATQKELQKYDQSLLELGYTMIQLVGFAALSLVRHPINANNIGVVCGNGNNGADGLALALLLSEKHNVSIYLTSMTASLTVDHYLQKIKDANISIVEDLHSLVKEDVIIDAIFGSGLNRDVKGKYYDIIDYINNLNKYVISIDIPSGLDCNTGLPKNIAIKATETRSICALKKGFLQEHSKIYTGEVIHCPLTGEETSFSTIVDLKVIQGIIKSRKYNDYKGRYGKIIHITGSTNYPGAALLAAKSSVYSGSGVVCCYSTTDVLSSLTNFVPECICKHRLSSIDIEIYNQYNALLLGSGLGLEYPSEEYVKEVLERGSIPLVIDGDALTYSAMHLNNVKKYQGEVVMTPHLGEFKRLHPFYNEEDMVLLAKEFALKWGVTLVLKGPNTIITNGRKTYCNITGNSAMATAGSGDVLAGIIVSYLGQGYSTIDAAILGVFIHGMCGDLEAKENYTAIPSKIIEHIPSVMKSIIEKTRP